jgi:hypothetical protein
MDTIDIRLMWDSMAPSLNEKQRRQYAATLARTYGYGGATAVHLETGIALNTITNGKRDLERGPDDNPDRIRRLGGGAKSIELRHPQIYELLHGIVDDHTYGDPQRVISWTTESLRKIRDELFTLHEISISHASIGTLLRHMGYSKQSNQKNLQVGAKYPDRNAQFEFINAKAVEFIDLGKPVISVDTKKKELIGNFKNSGREYRPKGDPRQVLDHDFPIQELGKVAPYGVYNLNNNTGFVNLGTSHDTGEFAAESISRWWECLGKHTFPNATELFITCDRGGSNGNRLKLWKYQLSQLASRASLNIHVSHFPPGTSKWNKIEHRLFCYISKHWAGKPLLDVQTVVDLIASTTTRTGLKVVCVQDDAVYELARKVTNEEFASIPLMRIAPYEQWNYIIGGGLARMN